MAARNIIISFFVIACSILPAQVAANDLGAKILENPAMLDLKLEYELTKVKKKKLDARKQTLTSLISALDSLMAGDAAEFEKKISNIKNNDYAKELISTVFNLDMETFIKGSINKVNIQINSASSAKFYDCKECLGAGYIPCRKCGGAGKTETHTCEKCSGIGQLKCINCDGKGFQDEEVAEMTIEPDPWQRKIIELRDKASYLLAGGIDYFSSYGLQQAAIIKHTQD